MSGIIVLLCSIYLFLSSSSGATIEAKLISGPDVSPCVSGVLEVPHGTGPFPGVILLHGAAGWDSRYPNLAKVLADSGFATLALDYYAEAGPSAIRSEEKLQKWPLYQATVRNAVEYMHKLPYVADQPVALVGFSRGAFLAISVASSVSSVKAVVDFFGGGGGGTESLEQEVQGLPPLLILHGDADRIVPVKFAHDLRDAVVTAGGEVEMHIYPGEGHGLSEATMRDGLQRTVEFLRLRLGN